MNHVSYRDCENKRQWNKYCKLKLSVILLSPSVSNLSTEAVEETKPYVHKSKTTGLKQEVAQEEGDTQIGPASMDEQQPLKEPELGQGKIRILHCLTSLHPCYSHSNMSGW